MKKRTLRTAAALLFMTVLSMPAFAEEYDLGDGSIEIWTDTAGKQHVSQPDNGISDEAQTTPTVITQENTAATQNTVTITAAQDQTTEVTLKHVNIDVSGIDGSAAVSTSGAGNVTIELDDSNTIRGGYDRAGLEKDNTGSLTITDANNDSGSLDAAGGDYGAGIGGSLWGSGSNITISGGEVNATGGLAGAGIGGGFQGSGSNITISGGTVTAMGGRGSAGIGGGDTGNGRNITITGSAQVTAKCGLAGAGIGGGVQGNGSEITVSGDVQIKVQGGNKIGIYGTGAPIGNGGTVDGGLNPIDGAEVTPDVSELTAAGKIEYYASDANMDTADYTQIITGTHVHDFDDGVVTTQPTCTKKGVMTYTCQEGNKFTITKEISPQHDYGTPEVWKYSDEVHYKECQRVDCPDKAGSRKDEGGHIYETATSQVCTVCKYDRGHQHSLTLVPKKEASCTEAGHKAYYTCSGCNALFGDGFGVFSVSLADLTIPATGHKYEGYTCATCGYQKTETNTSTTRSSSGSHHDSADVTDNSQKGRWVQDEKGWYFRRDDGSYPKSGWTKLKWLGKEYWYYFDENGYMKLGWLDVNGSRYYLNPVIGTNSGKMLTCWQQIENQWYYFSTETGAKEGSLLRNTVTPDNYRVDENGIWQQ